MNKSDLVRCFAARAEVPIGKAEELVNIVFDTIALSLKCEEDVKISGFGKFEVRHRNPCTKINPRTGEPVKVPAKKSFGFVPSPVLKGKINEEFDGLQGRVVEGL